jgi:hypothetical protein
MDSSIVYTDYILILDLIDIAINFLENQHHMSGLRPPAHDTIARLVQVYCEEVHNIE